MEFTAEQLAELLEGSVEGNKDTPVSSLAGIDNAGKNALTFFYNLDYIHELYTTDAGIVIINDSFTPDKSFSNNPTLIKVADARMAFGQVLKVYKEYKTAQKNGIHPTAVISETAQIGENVYLGPYCFVGENAQIGNDVKIYGHAFIGEDVKIGDRSIFSSGVRINDECIIGEDCIFQSGAVIGSDGFGFQPDSTNRYEKIIHVGNVIIENHVEIGANTTIDRATFGSTRIKQGVKLDNLIQVGHNVEIGENTVIAAQSGIAGSVKIGRDCMIGGQVGFAGHQKIGDGVKIAAQSGIQGDVEKETILQGSPAFEIGEYKRSYVMFRKLPDMKNQLDKLKKSFNN